MKPILVVLGIVLSGFCAYGQNPEETARRDAAAGVRVPPRVGPGQAMQPDVREQFLAIERIARMPMDQRKAQIPRLYGELAPPLMNGTMIEGLLSSQPANLFARDRQYLGGADALSVYAEQLEAVAGKMTPEEAADGVMQAHGVAILRVAGRRRMIQALGEHPEELKRLIDADLASDDPARAARAFVSIQGMKLTEYGDRLVTEYLAGGPRGEEARRSLIWMHDPNLAAKLLKQIEADPKAIVKHGGLLAGMISGKPADPVLMKLFDSPDPEIRLHAAVALEQSGDPKLADVLPKLIAGGDEKTIHAALLIAYNLPKDAFVKVRASMLPLMANADLNIATEAVWVFGKQKDMAAAPVILGLLQLPAMEVRHQVKISQAMGRLTDRSFNYDIHNWGPANPRNQKAIAEFAGWVEQNSRRQP